MVLLSTTEQAVLLAVWALGDEAYGPAIRAHIEGATGRNISIGAIYAPLERLAAAGMLSRRTGEPTAERGGRAKRYYSITAEGVRALEATRKATDSLWSALPDRRCAQAVHAR